MSLHAAWTTLDVELNSLSKHLRDFSAQRPLLSASLHFSVLDECLLEGLLSRVWQAWCSFCRTCVIDSCIGTVNRKGVVIDALPDAASKEHVSGAAIRAARMPKCPWQGQANRSLRTEPTWGDVDILVRVLTRLHPVNEKQLVAGLSSGHPSAKALQLKRNGAAHNHHQNLAEIQTLQSAYLVFPIGHPTHAMFWTEPNSGDFLVTNAIQDLKDAGFAATS